MRDKRILLPEQEMEKCMTRQYKRIEELEIWDDFMFGAVMSNKELCKHLLEIILQKKIKDIRYTELQKTIDLQYDAKSIRLDVYVENDLDSVYNIEIQTTDEKNLPKRSRFYQGMIDLNILNKGESYNKLKKSYVIFICNYDPFRKGRCFYRFENVCVDDPSLKLEDIFQISGDILADSNVCLKIAAELIETIAPAEKSAGASRITKR